MAYDWGESNTLVITMRRGLLRARRFTIPFVRRMLAAVGFPVWRLVRVRVGPVGLGRIRPGGVRPLDPDEVMALYRVIGMRRARPRRR